MVIKLLILTWELRYPQKRGFNKKRGGGGGVGSCSAWGNEWGQMAYFAEGRVCLGHQGS